MKIYKITLIALLAVFFIGACNTATETKKEGDTNKTTTEKTDENKSKDDKTETASANFATPTDAIKAFVEGIKAEDEKAIKATLSEKSNKMLDLMAKISGKSFYKSLTEDDKDGELKEMPEMKNEKIDGDSATLEVKGKNDKNWDTVPFVKENGSWKIAFLDKEYDKDYENISKQAEKMKKDSDAGADKDADKDADEKAEPEKEK